MQSAIDVIKDTYDYETCKEIVDHGCQSGVCSEHIYYADTVRFFDTHEDEIDTYVRDVLGDEELGEIFKASNYVIREYKNNMVWAFIELTASLIVDQYESTTCEEEETIASYYALA